MAAYPSAASSVTGPASYATGGFAVTIPTGRGSVVRNVQVTPTGVGTWFPVVDKTNYATGVVKIKLFVLATGAELAAAQNASTFTADVSVIF